LALARLQAHGQLAARKAALGPLARRPLQPLEARRPTEADLQVAAVDAARLHRPAPGPKRALRPPEPGHPAQRQPLTPRPASSGPTKYPKSTQGVRSPRLRASGGSL